MIQENNNPFYYEYSNDRHRGRTYVDPWEPLWLSFDFNINPTTCVIGQKYDNRAVIHECVQIDGGTEYLCDVLIDMGVLDHPAGLMVTGDNSGTHGSSSAGMEPDGRNKTDFSTIQNKLMVSDRFFVEAYQANKRLVYSRKLCNFLFKNGNFMVDENCHQLISDFTSGLANDKGGLVKDRKEHKQDAGDAARYLINAWFPGGTKDIDNYFL
jgi:hypothetical protein